MSREWYVEVMGEMVGPYTPSELHRLVDNGTLTPEMNIRQHGNQWTIAASAEWLFPSEYIEEERFKREMKGIAEAVDLFTTENVIKPGWEIVRTYPAVFSRCTVGVSALSELAVGAVDFVGGRSRTIEREFQTAEFEVIHDLKFQASCKRANAILKLQIQHGAIERGNSVMLYVTGQGTPASLRRIEPEETDGIEIDEFDGIEIED